MAKILRKLLNEAKDKMTDEVFFTSRVMKAHFESIIEGVCKTFKRHIQIQIINEGNLIACTNGDTIIINLNNDWIKKQPSRIDKYYIIVGEILHECGHILYTDFGLNLKSCDALEHDKLFPIIDYSDTLSECFDENLGRKLIGLYNSLDNCIEDGHIEKRVMRYVPGYGECLHRVRKLHLTDDGMLTYEQEKKMAEEKKRKVNRIRCIIRLVLIYAKFGIDNTGDLSDDLTQAFQKMIPHIDRAVATNNSVQRKREINIIFDMLVDLIKEELQTEKEKEKPAPPKSGPEDPSEDEEDSEGTSEEDDEDESASEEEKDDSMDPGVSEDGDEETSRSETSDESSESDETDEGEIMKELEETLEDLDDLLKSMSDKTGHSETPPRPVSDEDEKSEAFGDTPEEGSSFTPEGVDGPEDWDLSHLEDSVAEEEVAKATKKKIVKAMSKNSDDTRKGREDKYPSVEKYEEPDSYADVMYDAEHEELDRIARRVVKNLDKVIKERQKGDKLTGLYTGKMLDIAHTYRKDHRIFAHKIQPEDVPDMEVCVLVDCSGSMSCGDRMAQSRRCAYITWKFCQIMDIPCSVYGHTTDCSEKKVQMTCVAHPDNLDKFDGKRIFMLRPERNNRDGWAVNFCAEALSKSRATSKLLLIISDGVPAALGYGAKLGKKDCQEVVKRYKKKGISIVTAGIDDCAGDIKGVYLDGVAPKDAATFLDYSDMTQLPRAFATLIKKELL